MTAKTPHQPHKPPPSHHKNTTPKHTISAKTPAKTPLHHKIKKLPPKQEKGDPATAEPPRLPDRTYTVA
jgi:hypothetical protein